MSIPTFMIVIKNNKASEYYASITLPEWRDLGYDVRVFDAHTPDNMPTSFSVDFGFVNSDKYKRKNIRKEFTPSEKGCWLSHLALWKTCMDLNQHIMVLEHDAYPLYPDAFYVDTKYDFITYDQHGSGCYIISPRFAAFSWDRFVTHKDKIILGPCGHIYAVSNNQRYFNIIHWESSGFVPACGQIHNNDYGSTISHYKDTQIENNSYNIERYEATNPTNKIKITTN